MWLRIVLASSGWLWSQPEVATSPEWCLVKGIIPNDRRTVYFQVSESLIGLQPDELGFILAGIHGGIWSYLGNSVSDFFCKTGQNREHRPSLSRVDLISLGSRHWKCQNGFPVWLFDGPLACQCRRAAWWDKRLSQGLGFYIYTPSGYLT